VFVYVEAQSKAGKAEAWAVELGSPAALAKFAVTEKLIKVGERVTIEGWRAKDGSLKASAKTVILADGTQLFGASSFFDTPYRESRGKVRVCISDEKCIGMPVDVTRNTQR